MDTVSHASTGALTGAVVAELMLPSATTSLIVIGVVAGLLPDIDFLAELKGKVAAWTMHRIVAHNIPAALLLATMLAVIAGYSTTLPLLPVFIVCVSAAGIHLLLDVLTSFGTCLLYPFNSSRFTTRSHFIFDPIVIVISVVGSFSASPLIWMTVLLVYLSAGVLVRHLLKRRLSTQFFELSGGKPVQLEPRFLAPFRWLIILQTANGYRYAYQSLFWRSPWYQQDNCVVADTDIELMDDIINACQNNTLLRAVLVTFDMPVFTLVKDNHSLCVLVEDLKWRLEPQLRPMVFTARVLQGSAGVITLEKVKQGGFFKRSDTMPFARTTWPAT